MPAERNLDALLRKGISGFRYPEKWQWMTDKWVHTSEPPLPEDIVMKINMRGRSYEDDTDVQMRFYSQVSRSIVFGKTVVELGPFLWARQPPPGTHTDSMFEAMINEYMKTRPEILIAPAVEKGHVAIYTRYN